ncbi:MAG: MarR family winged helix-turn-helix transcriptional regulator [Sphingorhabdus sp.]
MKRRFSKRHPFVELSDELIRLSARVTGMFNTSLRELGHGPTEMLVLSAIVEADTPPTVPKIGRSLGLARQLVQRAVHSLVAQGLIQTRANPDHKRAVLLYATRHGEALKQKADSLAEDVVNRIAADMDLERVRSAAEILGAIRKDLETRLRLLI